MAVTEPGKRTSEGLAEMPFLQHLEDLRRVIIQTLVALLLATVVCWFFSERLLNLLIRDLPVESLYFSSPIEAFMIRVQVSLVVGLLIATPFVLFRLWAFVAPGLFAHERKRVYPLVITSSLLFYIGVAFCYFVLIPAVLKFLLGFGTNYLNPLLSVSSYFKFVARMCITFGIVFQIPIVVFLLSSLGLVTPGMLLRQWRYGLLVVTIGSAILTPPDALSLLMMAIPVFALYIGSVLVSLVVVRRRQTAAPDRRGVS